MSANAELAPGATIVAPTPRQPLHVRALRLFAVAILVAAAIGVLVFVYQFALSRFFTIDEYQWGHATWLVSEGKVPYRDFYEHHLPLGYILHSLFLSDSASFTQRALLLRKLAFAYILVGASLAAVAAYVSERSPFRPLLSLIVPISVGFGLMSAIDYRGDNWSAFTLISCFAVLEMNQTLKRPWLAALSGVLFSCAVLMTQKTLLVGGPTIALMLILSAWRQLAAKPPGWLLRFDAQQIEHPARFCVGAAVPVTVLLAVGAWFGQVQLAFQITAVQALQHEQMYPSFSAWKYLEPYLTYAPVSTALLAACAMLYLVRGHKAFWAFPTLVALLGVMGIKAPYPYNYVLVSFLLGLCAIRAYSEMVRWSTQRWPVLKAVSPLFYLFPLVLVPSQLGFVDGVTTNTQQLETLRIIEANTTPDEVVIDSAGGALFRPHRSYYWYQGRAHMRMFSAYFREDFLNDLRASQALFWISGSRTKQLPKAARQYLSEHYIPMHGDLNVLGFAFPRTPTTGRSFESRFEVVRAGEYYLSTRPTATGIADTQPASTSDTALRIDGLALNDSLMLEVGWHHVWVPVGAPGYRLSYLPASVLDDNPEVGTHAPYFEFQRPQ